jgi:hypothetical protein
MIEKHKLVAEAFLAAGRDLGIDVVAPFDLIVDGRGYSFLAFLPHFGGPKGMVVAAMTFDSGMEEAAAKTGYYVSSVNVDAYDKYDREHYIDTLNDWGFYGPGEKRPRWQKPSSW